MQHKGGKDHKKWKYGGKQMHGHSRMAYYQTRKLWRAAANKAKRIEKDRKAKEVKKQDLAVDIVMVGVTEPIV